MGRVTKDDFIHKANNIHCNKYDYALVDYKTNRTNVKIICPTHGIFEQRPGHHLSGHGCNICAANFRGTNRRLSIGEFIKKANNIHQHRYDYCLVDYTTAQAKVKIVCKYHGIFEQTPNHHLSSRGCPKCGVDKRTDKLCLTKEEFIEKANKIHEYLYDYNLVVYINAHVKVKIICNKHGCFEQEPTNHLCGQNCPKCSVSSVSKREIKWLDSLNVPLEQRQAKFCINGKIYKVDGYDLKKNTVYEFNGDFWHGNPKIYKPTDVNPVMKVTYGDLYKRTLDKEKMFKTAGYNVVSIWESDFENI